MIPTESCRSCMPNTSTWRYWWLHNVLSNRK